MPTPMNILQRVFKMRLLVCTKVFLVLMFFMHNISADEMLGKCGFLAIDLASENQKLKLSFTNNSQKAIYIPKWLAGEINGQLEHEIFIVKNFFGLTVRYKGSYYKRPEPTIEDMIKIEPLGIFNSIIDLKHGYVKNRGTYSVTYSSYVDYYIYDDLENGKVCFEEITSNKVKIKIK